MVTNGAVCGIMRKIDEYGGKPLLIAIDGRCAAGKTTLAAALQEKIDCNVIHMDYFFLRPEQRSEERLQEPGGNVDYERFLDEVMFPLMERRRFSYRKFDCKSMEMAEEIGVEPKAVTIVEGSYSCHPALWDFYDFHIFLSVEKEEQIRRIAERDGEGNVQVFAERWIPMEERYFEAYEIDERCEVLYS